MSSTTTLATLERAHADHLEPVLSQHSKRHTLLSRTRLLNGWSPVERFHFEQRFTDGSTEILDRDINVRGDGVTVLLYSRARGTVLLLSQPRIVATLRGDPSGETLEACSGLLESNTAAESARLEVLQETGYVPHALESVASVYSSPGSNLELVHLFIAEYSEERHYVGGGLRQEGEDIEVFEIALQDAMELTKVGAVRDARTILLLQHLALSGLLSPK